MEIAELERTSVAALLRQQAQIMDVLNHRGVLRSHNNPAGDFAEFLFAKAFNWDLSGKSGKGFDASDASYRYQIKARRLTREKMSRQLSAIRSIELRQFDFLAGVIFAKDFGIHRAAIIPYDLLRSKEPRFSKHVNGHLFNLTEDVWTWPRVRDVTEDLRSCAASL
jgi:hypothetical protein